MTEDKPNEEMVVTPWEVKGKIDYMKLIKQFGTQFITPELRKRLASYSNGEEHLFLRRGLYFSHRDLNWILDMYDKGEKFALYTGRGPSGRTHIGHLVAWHLTKFLQDKFDAELYFQITDDEKFLFKEHLKLDETIQLGYDNALDVIAIGFDPKKTYLIHDVRDIDLLYHTAIRVAKRVTFSTARAVFGFKNDSNIGQIFFPSIQAVPAFLPSLVHKKKVPVLIPSAIDQDPYWRIARDIAHKLGFYKPAAIQGMFLPGLLEGGKMSSSIEESAIFTTDTPKAAKKKVMKAFTGGRVSVEEQRKLGGNPNICSVFQYFRYLFEPDDKKLKQIETECRNGERLCGECKLELAEKIGKFLIEHQEKREKAKDIIDEFSSDRLREKLKE